MDWTIFGQFASLMLFFSQFFSYAGKLKYGKSISGITIWLLGFSLSAFVLLTFLV